MNVKTADIHRTGLRPLAALAACACLLGFGGCEGANRNAPPPGAGLRKGPPRAQRESDVRRLLYAQIVEDEAPNVFSESAILEGAAYKHFVKLAAGTTHDLLRKASNEKIAFEHLMAQPGLYRGQAVTLARGVALEVSQAALPPEYNLPEGYTMVLAVFVDSLRDVYALRIVCAPGSKLFERLHKGIEDDALPVLRVCGYFMKLYARKTADPRELPWRRPLLVCPEPEFSQAVEPRSVAVDLQESRMDRLLPSERIDAPGAEERLVIELLPPASGNDAVIRANQREAGKDLPKFLEDGIGALRRRLPREQAGHPAAVVLVAPNAPRARLNEILVALRNLGVKRLAVKSEK